jgi:3-dehydroquinate dehydratase-1
MRKPSSPRIVGVIFTRAELQGAVRLRNLPDLFELRLDALTTMSDEVEDALPDLRAPLIITARHPREGGANRLSARKRRRLLQRFLPRAAYVDIELRSADTLSAILAEARATGVRTIISFHDFRETPGRARLDEIARAAQSLGADLLKIATRTDTTMQVKRLLDFFQHRQMEMHIAAMGIGRLGTLARRLLFRQGSILNYVRLGRTGIAGQPSLQDIRRWTRGPAGAYRTNANELPKARG